jgi:hypothetical protein
MLNTANFSWKDNKLYLGPKDTKYSLQPCLVEGTLVSFYKVKYPDGELSEGYYNLSWAKEHCIAEATKSINNGVLPPGVAQGCV